MGIRLSPNTTTAISKDRLGNNSKMWSGWFWWFGPGQTDNPSISPVLKYVDRLEFLSIYLMTCRNTTRIFQAIFLYRYLFAIWWAWCGWIRGVTRVLQKGECRIKIGKYTITLVGDTQEIPSNEMTVLYYLD